jgi:hypothetical protein
MHATTRDECKTPARLTATEKRGKRQHSTTANREGSAQQQQHQHTTPTTPYNETKNIDASSLIY